MAESSGASKGQSSPKKSPKKLVVVDANEQPGTDVPKPVTPAIKPIKVVDASGDTPPIKADDAELANLADAIDKSVQQTTVPDAVPAKKAKSIRVSSLDDEPLANADSKVSQAASADLTNEIDPSMTVGEALDQANLHDDINQQSVKQGDSDDDATGDVDTDNDTTTDDIAEQDDTIDLKGDSNIEPERLNYLDELSGDAADQSAQSEDPATNDESARDDVATASNSTGANDKANADALDAAEAPEQESTTKSPGAQPTKKPVAIDDFSDPTTARQVDDIVAREADELLAREDADALRAQKPVKKQNPLKRLLAEWWVNPATRWGTVVGVLLLLAGIALLPGTRYFALNTAGIRVQSSVSVISADSLQPLKNVDVSLGGKSAKTNEKGEAEFSGLRLGKSSLKISKRGYQDIQQSKVLGWGSNPLGRTSLQVGGTQFSFVVVDFLSGKSLQNAEAVSGDFNAQADKDGKVKLPIDQDKDADIQVTIKVPEYSDQKITIKASDTAEKNVKMVPFKKHVFVSKRSGKLDLYKIDADGTHENLLLAGTGSERDDLMILLHPTDNYVAVISTRDNKRNKDGYLLSGLFMVNVTTGEMTKVAQSERIQLVDWVNDRVIFVAVTDGASAANPSRSKLFSFELGQPGPKTIASANYFNDTVVFRGAVYYAPSSFALPVSSVKFYKVNPDGSGQTTVADREVWNVFRSEYDSLLLSVQQDWYQLKSADTAIKLPSPPANPKNRTYIDSPDKKHAIWVDNRDGKGVLLNYSIDSKTDSVVQTQSGLTAPMNWLSSSTVVYRIKDGRETADYIKSIHGGDAKKLRDVTTTDAVNYYN